jgi:DNA-binding transcriptional MerR regulator
VALWLDRRAKLWRASAMKMRELERKSGVGRETIRYYLGLGLLPEPQRPKPNVADYDDEHVRRLRVIKRLQQERYLPLTFIKTLLERPSGGELTPFPDLDISLSQGLGLASQDATLPMSQAPEVCGLPIEELETLARDGVIRPDAERRLSAYDIAIAQTWARAKAAGYTQANGFFPEDLKLYVDAIDAMSRIEIERFYTSLSGGASSEEVARMGQAGVEIFGEMILRLRTRRLLQGVAELNESSSVASV